MSGPAGPHRRDRRDALAHLRQGSRDGNAHGNDRSPDRRPRPVGGRCHEGHRRAARGCPRQLRNRDRRPARHGRSGAVACELGDDADATACATALGNRRRFYTTPETAHDLENLRVALGVEKLTLLGVSYGAKVAGEYARRYPAHTARLILDSPAPVDGIDGYDQLRTLGTPRVLREVCFPGLCHQTLRDPTAALAAAAERLQDGAVRGPLVDRSGRIRTASIRERDLYAALIASDLDPYLRAGLPAAVASLAEGDAAPLLHLAGRAAVRRRHRHDQHRAAAGDVMHRGPPAVGARFADREPRRRAQGVRRRALRELRAVQRGDRDRQRPDQPLRDVAADAEAGERAVRRPERPGADPLGPRRPAHAARGRPPHRGAVPGRAGARRPRRRPLRA